MIVKLDSVKKELINSSGERFHGDVLNIITAGKAAKFAFENNQSKIAGLISLLLTFKW